MQKISVFLAFGLILFALYFILPTVVTMWDTAPQYVSSTPISVPFPTPSPIFTPTPILPGTQNICVTNVWHTVRIDLANYGTTFTPSGAWLLKSFKLPVFRTGVVTPYNHYEFRIYLANAQHLPTGSILWASGSRSAWQFTDYFSLTSEQRANPLYWFEVVNPNGSQIDLALTQNQEYAIVIIQTYSGNGTEFLLNAFGTVCQNPLLKYDGGWSVVSNYHPGFTLYKTAQ